MDALKFNNLISYYSYLNYNVDIVILDFIMYVITKVRKTEFNMNEHYPLFKVKIVCIKHLLHISLG